MKSGVFKEKQKMQGAGALCNLDPFHNFAWGCLNYCGLWANFLNDGYILYFLDHKTHLGFRGGK